MTGIILIPILITLANDLGLDAWFLVAPAAFSSSLGIILVTQTPTSIIPYTSGYFSIRDFAWAGVIMTVLMIGILAATLVAMGALWGTYRI